MKLVALLFCLFSAALGFGSGISSTVFSLPAYQTENGGFHTQKFEGVPGDAEETEHALFLASLFGAQHMVNVEFVKAFLYSLSTPDHGFTNAPGQASDIEAVRNVIFSLAYLGEATPEHEAVTAYINSLYDSSSHLFRPSPGASPDFKSTARALEALAALRYNGPDLKERKTQIVEKLKSSEKYEDGLSFFSYLTTDNYYAILTGHLAGYNFQNPSSWVKYFSQRQVPAGAKKGGFFSDNYGRDISVDDLYAAVRSIFLLKGRGKVNSNDINLHSLIGYLSTLPRGLDVAARAYGSLASTIAFQESFKTIPTYAVRDNRFKVTPKRIVQGTIWKPSLQVRTTYGLVHPSLTASLEVEHDGEVDTKELYFNPETQLYETDEWFDSGSKFGPTEVVFNLQWDVFGFDTIVFRVAEEKSIGYDMKVAPKATYGETAVSPGGTVGIGSTFDFDLKLATLANLQLKGGDFEITFSVLDSSNVPIHSVPFHAKDNAKPITFNYVLSSTDIPAGRLTFRFEVSNQEGVHTIEEIWYTLQVRMVASNINFPTDKVVRFGQTLTVTMEPATLPDLRTVQKYRPGNRQFFLDLYSQSHILLASYPGDHTATESTSQYTFSINLQPRFDVVGTNFISFRYRDAYGNDIKLLNYDSTAAELSDEGDSLQITVDAALEITHLKGLPQTGVLEYGNEFHVTFNVQDTHSGMFVYRGSNEGSVYLVLRHPEKDGTSYFTSTKTRAYVEGDTAGQPTNLVINWVVDPNSVKDKGVLQLVIQDSEGREVPLRQGGKPWTFDVSIGGELNIESATYSRQFDQFDSIFLATFVLSCQETFLNGADLIARVIHVSGAKRTVINTLPVSGGMDGNYQVSWTLDNRRAKSGEYRVEIYRKVDLSRSSTPDKYEGAAIYFALSQHHEGHSVSPLPFKTEFLVLVVLIGSAVFISLKKGEIEKANK